MWALIKGLPDDAAVWREDNKGWSQHDELLAQLIELTDFARREVVYWLQMVTAGHGRIYKDLEPEVPAPLVGENGIEHPGRSRPPSERRGEAATRDRDLPPVLTADMARQAGFL